MVDGGGGSCSSRGDLVEEVLGREGGDLSMSILWMVSGEVGLLPGIRGGFFSWDLNCSSQSSLISPVVIDILSFEQSHASRLQFLSIADMSSPSEITRRISGLNHPASFSSFTSYLLDAITRPSTM